jgi:hypothetical protein
LKANSKKNSGYESGSKVGTFYEKKTGGRKSHATVPLTRIYSHHGKSRPSVKKMLLPSHMSYNSEFFVCYFLCVFRWAMARFTFLEDENTVLVLKWKNMFISLLI